MKTLTTLAILLSSWNFYAQIMPLGAGPVPQAAQPPGGGQNEYNTISFTYDSAGNQTRRNLIYLAGRSSNAVADSLAVSNTANKGVFLESEYSDLKYWPNPVKSELFLKWGDLKDNKVNEFRLYDMNGRFVTSVKHGTDEGSAVIDFVPYPIGLYSLELIYNNGDKKTLRIVKQ